MRITGGEFKGRVLKIPKKICPTQDKVREAIFNILGDEVKDSKFLDLFAGSGSVGIEALSRGAREVVFVDKAKSILKILKENLEATGKTAFSKVICRDALKVELEGYDIVFADPPYDRGFVAKILHLLPKNSLIIIEHSKREQPSIGRHYKYGDTILTFITS